MIAVFVVCLILAVILFALAAGNVSSNINLMAFGLFFFALYFLLQNGVILFPAK